MEAPPPSNTFVLRGRIDRATGPEVGVVLHGTWYDGAGGTFANTRFVHEQTPMGADGKPPDGLYMGRMTIATDKRRQIVDRMGLRFAAAAAADAGGGADAPAAPARELTIEGEGSTRAGRYVMRGRCVPNPNDASGWLIECTRTYTPEAPSPPPPPPPPPPEQRVKKSAGT